jgi:hypothetical protein
VVNVGRATAGLTITDSENPMHDDITRMADFHHLGPSSRDVTVALNHGPFSIESSDGFVHIYQSHLHESMNF